MAAVGLSKFKRAWHSNLGASHFMAGTKRQLSDNAEILLPPPVGRGEITPKQISRFELPNRTERRRPRRLCVSEFEGASLPVWRAISGLRSPKAGGDAGAPVRGVGENSATSNDCNLPCGCGSAALCPSVFIGGFTSELIQLRAVPGRFLARHEPPSSGNVPVSPCSIRTGARTPQVPVLRRS